MQFAFFGKKMNGLLNRTVSRPDSVLVWQGRTAAADGDAPRAARQGDEEVPRGEALICPSILFNVIFIVFNVCCGSSQ